MEMEQMELKTEKELARFTAEVETNPLFAPMTQSFLANNLQTLLVSVL